MKLDKMLTKFKIYGQKKRFYILPERNPLRKSPADQCEIAICDNIVYAKGFCNSHYQRALKLNKKGVDKTQWYEAMNTPIRKKKRRG